MNAKDSLKDIVYNAILEDILSMEYRPGQILNEKTMIEKYQYSKSPIREALQALCGDGVLRNIPRYGYEIIKLSKDDVYEMIQYRRILETGMLKEKFNSLGAVHLERLRAIDEQCKNDEYDIWTHWEYNTQFHLKLMSFCGNEYVVGELERCMNRLKRAYAQFYWDKGDHKMLQADTRYHARILESLKNKDMDLTLFYLAEDLNDFGGADNFLHYHSSLHPSSI